MPIWNIIDHRTQKYRWKSVDVAAESTAHDNRIENSDQAPSLSDTQIGGIVDSMTAISIEDAISWGQTFSSPVTLFIYDGGALQDPGED